MVKITIDANANQKELRKLQKEGIIEIFAINIENIKINKKINNKEMPLAIFDSPHSHYDNAVYASDDSKYSAISAAMTRQNHGDAVHLEGHIRSGRDYFVTDDHDFLNRRVSLEKEFGISIKSTDEIIEMLMKR